MEKLFAYQLIGDFFKMAYWVLAYLFLARAMTKFYIIVEFLMSLILVGLSWFFISHYGAMGATMAFAIYTFIAMLIHIIIFRKLLFGHE
jgi:PST family polysaccharide transporter